MDKWTFSLDAMEEDEQSPKGTEQKGLLEGRNAKALARDHTSETRNLCGSRYQCFDRTMRREKQIEPLTQETEGQLYSKNKAT